MPGMIIQFHAVPEELIPLLSWAMKDLSVHITAMRFWPFSAVEMRPDTLEVLFLDPSVQEIKLTLEAPRLPVAMASEFYDRHSSALGLDIGRLSEKGLIESCLSCRDADTRSSDVWKRIAAKLRGITKAGASATSLATGVTAKYKNHRYTSGAKALDDKGVAILPAAGTSVLHLGIE